MALHRRVLVRRGSVPAREHALTLSRPLTLRLHLALALGQVLLGSPAAAGAPSGSLLQAKARQAQTLQVMLASPAPLPDRGDRMFLLAQLELEVAILKEAETRGAGDWAAPGITCRRLLAELPRYPRAAEVRLFLARLELRRGRPTAAIEAVTELEQMGPPGAQTLCQAWSLAGEAWAAAQRRDRAAEAYRRILGQAGCTADSRQRARYQLAWTLLADKRPADAARELRALSGESISRDFRGRVLKDLVLAWSMSDPDRDSVAFLLRAGGAQGGLLVEELARLLLEERRLAPLLAATDSFRRDHPGHAGLPAVLRLRWLGLARLARDGELERELASIESTPLARQESVRGAIAAALEDRVRALWNTRQSGGAGQHEAARAVELPRVCQLLLRWSADPASAAGARACLGELALDEGQLQMAADHLDAAARRAPEPQRGRASYLLVYTLQRQLRQAAPGEQPGLRARLVSAARRLLLAYPQGAQAAGVASPDTAQIQLLLAAELLAARDYSGAARAAEAFLQRHPADSRRSEATKLALLAMDRAGLPEAAYRLMQQELGQCSGEAPRSECAAWRQSAAASAMARCRQLLEHGDLSGAEGWALRAYQSDPRGSGAAEALMSAGVLAVRRGAFADADRRFQDAIGVAGGAGERHRALLTRAELLDARGQFGAAATVYAEASRAAVDGLQRLRDLRRTALSHLAAGELARALRLARELGRAIEATPLRAPVEVGWQLRLGRLLERAGGPALKHYLSLAKRIEQAHPKLAAKSLLRAAEVARSPGQARLLAARAQELAGSLMHRGAWVEQAAEVRVARARIERRGALTPGEATPSARRAPSSGGSSGWRALARRLGELQDLVAPLLEVVGSADPRWATAAAAELAGVYGDLSSILARAPAPAGLNAGERQRYLSALRERAEALSRSQQSLLARLEQMARQGNGHSAALLAARLAAPRSRTESSSALLIASDPAAASTVEPLHSLIRRGQPRAAALAATRALALMGSRAELYCARGAARLAAEENERALRDFRIALDVAPDSRCARLGLRALGLPANNAAPSPAAAGAVGMAARPDADEPGAPQ